MDVQNVCKTGDSFCIKAVACPVWDTDKSFLSCTSAFLLLPPPLYSDSSPRCLIQANPKKAGILLLCGGSRSPSGCHWGGTGSSHPAVFLTHPTALYRHRISQGIGLNLAKFCRRNLWDERASCSPNIHPQSYRSHSPPNALCKK